MKAGRKQLRSTTGRSTARRSAICSGFLTRLISMQVLPTARLAGGRWLRSSCISSLRVSNKPARRAGKFLRICGRSQRTCLPIARGLTWVDYRSRGTKRGRSDPPSRMVSDDYRRRDRGVFLCFIQPKAGSPAARQPYEPAAWRFFQGRGYVVDRRADFACRRVQIIATGFQSLEEIDGRYRRWPIANVGIGAGARRKGGGGRDRVSSIDEYDAARGQWRHRRDKIADSAKPGRHTGETNRNVGAKPGRYFARNAIRVGNSPQATQQPERRGRIGRAATDTGCDFQDADVRRNPIPSHGAALPRRG